jgi:hypothetical protein
MAEINNPHDKSEALLDFSGHDDLAKWLREHAQPQGNGGEAK